MDNKELPNITVGGRTIPWGLEAHQLAPSSINTISSEKIKSITVGQQKKSPFQKHKEEMEAKKKRAEDEAAQIYAQFVESFEADSNTDTSKTFVRGETIVNNTIVHNNNNKEYDLKYNRSSKSSSSSSSTSSKPSSSSSSSSYSTTSKSSHAEKKKRSIDELKEELKRGQELRENRNKKYQRRDEYESSASTHGHNMDTENEHDTSGNLYVSNLAPQVTEQLLWREFGRYGSISSIKILWPKTEEEKRTRDRHCGFVVFTDRAAAERAKQELHGIDLYGAELRIAWANGPKSKSSSSSSSSSSLLGNPPSHHHSSSAPVRQPAPVPVPVPTPSHAPVPVPVPVVPQMIVVKVPADAAVKAAIDEVAVYIAQHKDGMQLEQLLMQREIHNPKYQFLHQGDTLSSWRATAFQMFIGGPFWLPPPPPNAAVPVPAPAPTHSMRHGGHGNTKRLPDDVRDEFEDMLRNLTVERNKIKAAMGFALDHAELSHEIVQIITESLTLKETPIGTKVARLYLVSDILHNSSASVPNASSYRSGFQNTLQSVFYSFHDTYRNIGGRITAENLKDQILKLLRIWENWSLYPQSFITELHYAFLKGPNSSNNSSNSNTKDTATSAKSSSTTHSHTRDTSTIKTDSKHTLHHDEDKPAPQLKKDEQPASGHTPTEITSISTATSSSESSTATTAASTSAEEPTTESSATAAAVAVEDEELEDVDGTALTEEDILELRNLPPNLLQTVQSIQSLLIKV